MKASIVKFSRLFLIVLLVSTTTPVLAESVTPTLSVIGELVLESDTLYGYETLRPASWDSVDLGDRRAFYPPGSIDKPDRIILEIADLQIVSELNPDPDLTIVNLYLFQKQPNLSGWVKGMEALWEREEISYDLIEKLPKATIFALSPLPNQVIVIALMVDKGRPIQIALFGFGSFGDLDKFRSDGLLEDFKVIVSNTSALENVLKIEHSNILSPLTLVHSDSGYIYDGAFQLRMMTEWYPDTHRVYWLYEYSYHPNYPTHTYWLYATFVTDDKDNTCVYDTGYYLGRAIDKHTTPTNGTLTDSYYPNYVNASIGTQTYHLLRYGDGMYWNCRYYQPFHS